MSAARLVVAIWYAYLGFLIVCAAVAVRWTVELLT